VRDVNSISKAGTLHIFSASLCELRRRKCNRDLIFENGPYLSLIGGLFVLKTIAAAVHRERSGHDSRNMSMLKIHHLPSSNCYYLPRLQKNRTVAEVG
jgi:hypothetical protein